MIVKLQMFGCERCFAEFGDFVANALRDDTNFGKIV